VVDALGAEAAADAAPPFPAALDDEGLADSLAFFSASIPFFRASEG
jgi:hypothetical protein